MEIKRESEQNRLLRILILEQLREFSAISCASLDSIQDVSMLPDTMPEHLPEYMQKSWKLRANPCIYLPWAKSVFSFAVSYSKLPDASNDVPLARTDELAGLVSAYALKKLDYHNVLTGRIAKFADSLSEIAGRKLRCEICVDSKPVAEKPLAFHSGLGIIGHNSCLRIPGLGSSIFLGELFTDLQTANLSFPPHAKGEMRDCSECGLCVRNCPSEAIANRTVDRSLCISAITMEKKGELAADEKRRIGRWIFGCDYCVSSCPDSDLPPPFKLDLEWLLFSSNAEITSAFKGLAISYASPAKLRRNAVAVLENIGERESLNLLKKYLDSSHS